MKNTEQRNPKTMHLDKMTTLEAVTLMNNEDKVEYDHIQTMDVPQKVKFELVSLLKFKSRDELSIIRDWLNSRLETF